jgi:hypothetical protein
MSAPKSDLSCHNHTPSDPFDRWLFRIFKVVLFVIALWALWKFLNEHVPVLEAAKWLVHRLNS